MHHGVRREVVVAEGVGVLEKDTLKRVKSLEISFSRCSKQMKSAFKFHLHENMYIKVKLYIFQKIEKIELKKLI